MEETYDMVPSHNMIFPQEDKTIVLKFLIDINLDVLLPLDFQGK